MTASVAWSKGATRSEGEARVIGGEGMLNRAICDPLHDINMLFCTLFDSDQFAPGRAPFRLEVGSSGPEKKPRG
jgi:hypothetical protein